MVNYQVMEIAKDEFISIRGNNLTPQDCAQLGINHASRCMDSMHVVKRFVSKFIVQEVSSAGTITNIKEFTGREESLAYKRQLQIIKGIIISK